jgi:uncharacterized membrane protein YhaH (DUF805 family)
MDWAWFLFSFKGRINRAGLWLALLTLICCMVFISVLITGMGRLLGGPTAFAFSVNDVFATLNPETYRDLSRSDLVPGIVHVIGATLFVWVFVATSVKRLHDRGRSGWWVLPMFVIPGLVNQFSDRIDEGLALVVGTVTALLAFWGFIELYCLAGEHWTNRFGPNPLAKAQTGSSPAQAAALMQTARDQQSELEAVPHVGRAPITHALTSGAQPAVQRLTSLFR